MSDIQEGCWFIENKELRLLADGPGQQNPLALPIAALGKILVSQLPGMDFSPATIRNEMVDLTTMRLLEQPHT